MRKAAIFLSGSLLLLCLSGCRSNTVAPPPEEMAAAILDLTLRNDPSPLQDLFDYTEETSVYKDFESLSQSMDQGFETFAQHFTGVLGEIPDEVVLPYYHFEQAVPDMLSKLKVTSEITTLEEDRAVLTFYTQSYDEGQFWEVCGKFWTMCPNLLLAFDPDYIDNTNGVNGYEKKVESTQLFFNVNYAFQGEILKNMAPSDDTAEFQAVFVPTEMTVNGHKQSVWLPEDPEALGRALVDAIMW